MQNAHGDVVALTNGAGEITKTYAYDPFGAEKNIDLADNNPFRYCSEYYDKGIDKIYLRARTYDPTLGRFTQQDPACDGFNWYVYCYNNPLKYLDTNGQSPYERFDTISDALTDWAWNYYGSSYYVGFEFASLIYTGYDKDGNQYYSYTYGVVGTPHNVTPSEAEEFLPKDANTVAYIHSHPNGKQISGFDERYTKKTGWTTYAVVPGDTVDNVDILKYESRDGVHYMFKEQPVASLTDDRKKELEEKFYVEWDNHTVICDSDFKCYNQEWPREWR